MAFQLHLHNGPWRQYQAACQQYVQHAVAAEVQMDLLGCTPAAGPFVAVLFVPVGPVAAAVSVNIQELQLQAVATAQDFEHICPAQLPCQLQEGVTVAGADA